jgi:uncharacterized membrane protein
MRTLGLLLLSGTLLSPAFAAEYTYTTLDIPIAGATETVLTGINDAGAIVGAYVNAEGNLTPVRYVPQLDRWHTMRIPRATGVAPQDINTQGDVVGTYSVGVQGGALGFLRQGVRTIPLDYPNALLTEALGMNDTPVVVGTYDIGVFDGFLYRDGVYERYSVLGAINTALVDINNGDQIVGVYDGEDGRLRGVLLMADFEAILIDYPDAVHTGLRKINDAGAIIGDTFTEDVYQSFLRAPDGTFQVIAYPDAMWTDARGLNNLGQIVGSYGDVDGVRHGFLATPDGASVAQAPRE